MITVALIGVSARGLLAEGSDDAGEAQVIVGVSIDAPPSVDAARAREKIRVRRGDRYDARAVSRDIAALFATGEFEDVRAEPKPVKGGIRLIYHLAPVARVSKVLFERMGKLDISDETLCALLTVAPGAFVNPVKLKRDVRVLRDRLRQEGYLEARVKQVMRKTDGEVEIAYRINPGPKMRIESVRFEGNTAVADEELRRVMLSVEEPGFFTKGGFDPALVEADVAAVQEVFRRRGYLEATAGHELVMDEAEGTGYLLVRVRQGPLYKVSHLRITGARVFRPDELAAAIELGPGEPYAPEQLDRDVDTIRQMYGRKGYIKARVEVTPTVSPEKARAALVLRVMEGPVFHVRKVLIRGNYRTKDHVIRRDVTLLPGAVANMSGLEETRRRLERTGLFAKDRATGRPAAHVEFADTEEPGLTDVLVEVTQGPPGELKVGGSWGTGTGLSGLFQVALYDFDALDYPTSWNDLVRGTAWRGGGQKLSLTLSPGTDYRNYSLRWKNPSVFDGPYFVEFSAYLDEFIWEDYYDQRRTGGAVSVGRRFGESLEVSVTPRIEQIDIGGLDSSAPFDARQVKGTHWRNSVAVEAVYDKRDDAEFTTEGYLLGAGVEMAGTVLGGDVDYLAESARARKWWTIWNQKNWGRHVVNVGGEVGAKQTTSSDSVPFFDRYFMGGIGTLRGFRARRAGRADSVFNRQIGGEYRLLLNAEYEAPLYEEYVRGVVFVDTGMVERSLSDMDFDALRASAGVGVRVRLPFLTAGKLPINLYVGVPLRKRSEDKTQLINVSIGTGFAF